MKPERPIAALLPIGWPIGRHGRPPRRSVDTCLFFDRFDEDAERERLRAAGEPTRA